MPYKGSWVHSPVNNRSKASLPHSLECNAQCNFPQRLFSPILQGGGKKGQINQEGLRCPGVWTPVSRAFISALLHSAGYYRFSSLLSRIPDTVKNDSHTQRILKKLEKFGKNPDMRIRPTTFLKVLSELRVWELCSPDICAAVEVTKVHLLVF